MNGDAAAAAVPWQEFWSGEASAGEPGCGGPAAAAFLAPFWRGVFEALPLPSGRAPVVVDVAAGGGAALRSAADTLARRGVPPVALALDISPAAAATVRRSLPGALAAAADARRPPVADGAADAVISQFGLEYAGPEGFLAAMRALAPGGRFAAVVHYRGGAIDAECAENEAAVRAVLDAGLVPAARDALAATFAGRARGETKPADPAAERRLGAAFGAASRAVAGLPPGRGGRQFVERFLSDLRAVATRRLAYADADALGWLAAMEGALAAYAARMAAMRAAALDRAGLDALFGRLGETGASDLSAAPAPPRPGEAPAGWLVTGTRAPA